MALLYVPTSELEAVNTMLEVINEQPVNSLETGYSEAHLARTVLHKVSRAVQKKGFNFNSEENYPLTADIDGNISAPLNALKVDPSDGFLDVTVRGTRLYDRGNHTYVFTETSIKVDVVFFLPFNELPECVREYVTIRAARRFAENYEGSADTSRFTEDDEFQALIDLLEMEAEEDDTTLLNNPDINRVVRDRRL